MNLKWFSIIAVLATSPAAAQNPVVLPPVPGPTKPLPDVPRTDSDGMPLIGFGYDCKASAGEDEFALSGTIGIGPGGEIGMITVKSASLAANPAQVLAPRARSTEPWRFIGTLRWQLHWLAWGDDVAAAGPYLNAPDGKLQFELTPEGSLADRLVISFTRKGDAALVTDGHSQKNIGYFFVNVEELLDFDGTAWLVNKWPYEGSAIAIKERFGYGAIRVDRIRAALANVEPLNRKFSELLGDYKNLCTPVPVYENNEIII